MTRGDVYDARLDPTDGPEQAGRRPVVIVSRNAITTHMPIVSVVPVTNCRADRRLYPSQVLLRAPEGGLTADSIALAEQVRAVAKGRLERHRGTLAPSAMRQIDHALSIALDLQR
ncbi:MAG TPA: type II toxin-antitoxin system PemK/MazF family toxin [bacterium]|nr:type II toxin-antitoxin system PemK/MazF family toxin [bacterium]